MQTQQMLTSQHLPARLKGCAAGRPPCIWDIRSTTESYTRHVLRMVAARQVRRLQTRAPCCWLGVLHSRAAADLELVVLLSCSRNSAALH